MQLASRQRGFSLGGLILVGVIVMLGIVYGRNIVGLAYHSGQMKTIMKAIAAGERTEADARKKFVTMQASEGLQGVGSVDDLEIEQKGEGLVLKLSYKECADINKQWQVCAKWDLATDK